MNYTEPKVIYTCFPGGKHKVLTMSYDDGRLEDRRLVELFNRYGIRGTFNLNGGLSASRRASGLSCTRAMRSPVTPTTTPPSPAARWTRPPGRCWPTVCSLRASWATPCAGLPTPTAAGRRRLPPCCPRWASATPAWWDTHDFAMPHDFMTWKATCHHTHNLLEDGKRFVELYKTQYLYMMYVWGHSFEFRTEEDWALMEQFCQLAGGREDTWYATNIEIVDYMADAARLQYTAAGDKVCNPNAQSIWVEVDGRHYEIPAGKTVALV